MPEGIIDAHHHLWDRERHPQPWIAPVSMAAIDADFAPVDLVAATKPSGVVVVVQSIHSAAGYHVWLQVPRDLLSGCGEPQRQQIWRETARRVYQLAGD